MSIKPNPVTKALRACLAMLAAAIVLSGTALAHTVQICWRDVGGVTTFYAGTYHNVSSPTGGIIVDGFLYPFSGVIPKAALPADAHCYSAKTFNPVPGDPDGVAVDGVEVFQTFTGAFPQGLHTIDFTPYSQVEYPWEPFPPQTFGGGGACPDADFDGICNADDACPLDAANDGDGDGRCANVDNCPLNFNPAQTDANGNGRGDACEGVVCGNGLVTGSEQCDDGNIAGGDGCSAICTLEIVDSDGDGVSDNSDICPGGDDRLDADADGVPDFCDPCPADAQNDSDGDGSCDSNDVCLGNDSSGDSDDDGLCDDTDPCVGLSNNDTDADGICDEGDSCLGDNATGDTDGDKVCGNLDACNGDDASGDSDGDRSCNNLDICPLDSSNDADGDGLCAEVDNCPSSPNADQADLDADSLGDICDADVDGDQVPNNDDNCVFDINSDQRDYDGDGAGDVCDKDDDNDGVIDSVDACLVVLGNTPDTGVVDASGCSVVDFCPCDNNWKNHGAYVSCVAHTTKAFVQAGLITSSQRGAIVSAAGRSNCGKKR